MGKTRKKRKKRFRTERAKRKFASWRRIIVKAKRDGVPRGTLKMMKRFQRSWLGK